MLLASLLPLARSGADTTDPVGYVSYLIPPDSHRLIGVPLIRPPTVYDTTASVSVDRIALSNAVDAGDFDGANSALVQVRTGAHAGVTFTATGHQGNELILDRSPVGFVSAGDTIQVFPNHTLATLFGPENSAGLLGGENAGEADTIGLWNAATQSSRIFYYQTGEGWREADNEAAGDQANRVVPFPDAIMLRRRASSQLLFVVAGGVPMPMDVRYFPVLPGRNLVSAPFSAAQTVADYDLYQEGSPFSVNAAASAPDADTIRFSNSTTSADSEVIYYRLGEGWRVAGSDGDAGATRVELGQAMDFQRKGAKGIIRTRGIVEAGAKPAKAIPVSNEVPITGIRPAPGGLHIEWPGVTGTAYQIQTKQPGASTWSNLGTPVIAAGSRASASCGTNGSGLIRIIRQ